MIEYRMLSKTNRSRIEELEQQLADEQADAEETTALLDKLSDILSRTAIALRGPEPPLTRWSWHDLPELVAEKNEQIKMLRDALVGLVQIARLTIGWSCTPANADGPLVVAEKALAATEQNT